MKYFYAYIFLFSALIGFSQELIVDWGECFGSNSVYSYGRAIEVLPNGNIISFIKVDDNNPVYTNYHGDSDSWVFILDEQGSIIHDRSFGGSSWEYFGDIEIFDDYIYFIGQTSSNDGDVQSEPIGGTYNLWVVKTDLDLNIIWERQYGCLGTQDFETAKITPEGGLILLMDFFNQGGGDVSEYFGETDIWVCVIDANGEILWEKTLGNAYSNHASDVIQNQDGNIVVLGYTIGSGGMVECVAHGAEDTWVVELDSQTQEIIWQNCYGGSELDVSFSIAELNDIYIIAGATFSTDGDVSINHGDTDAWLLEIDQSGQLLWEHCYGGSDADSFRNIFKTNDEGYFLFGLTNSRDGDVNNTNCPYPFCQTHTWVIELDSSKEMLWNGTHGSYGPSYHEKNAIKRTGERDFVIAARVTDEGLHLGDVDCEPYPVNFEQSAWIYRLYDPDVGIREYTNSLNLITYPNPAKTQITFAIPTVKKETKLIIQDIFAKTIAELALIKNQTQVIWNCGNISNGVYFYQTEISGVVYRGKIIVN